MRREAYKTRPILLAHVEKTSYQPSTCTKVQTKRTLRNKGTIGKVDTDECGMDHGTLQQQIRDDRKIRRPVAVQDANALYLEARQTLTGAA